MNKTLLTFLIIGLTTFSVRSQETFQYDSIIDKVYYDNVIQCDGLTSKEIYDQVKKYLSTHHIIRYDDGNELLATAGKFKTEFEAQVGIFHNTKEYRCFYTMQFMFKDGRMKYHFSDFKLVPWEVKLTSNTWFNSNTNMAYTSATMPTEIPQKPLEYFYNKGKANPKYVLFQDINKNVTKEILNIKEFVKTKKDKDW